MQNQAHLIGSRALAGRALGGQLHLVQLDQVFGLAARAINLLVEMLGFTRQRSDDVAGIVAQWCRLETNDHLAVAMPTLCAIADFSEGSQLVSALLGPGDLERVGGIIDQAVQYGVPGKPENVANSELSHHSMASDRP